MSHKVFTDGSTITGNGTINSPLVSAGGGGSNWTLTGNAGTTAGTNFLGTTDAQDVVIKRSNAQTARFYSDRLSIGIGAGNTVDGVFIGNNAGGAASGTQSGSSVFIGVAAGNNNTNSPYSQFIGYRAGDSATNAGRSNFIGLQAGLIASAASYSNFFGQNSGNAATNATGSNFLGESSGQQATNASYSNFIGSYAGYQASSASYSTLIGLQAGMFFTGNNLGSNNIIIGTNISLPNTTANAINIGGILFGVNTYATTTGDPSIAATSTGKIGIRTVTPLNTLHITSEAANTSGLRFQNLTSASPKTTGQAIGVDTNGDVIVVPILVDITYANLASAISGSMLIAGTTYRITDYQTVHTIPQTASTYTGSTEVLQVTAIDSNSLHPVAKSETYTNDIIYYNPTNETSIVPGCTKGYIYRRIDTINSVDICYDWREVTFRRWESDIPIYSAGTTYARKTFVRSNVDNAYIYVSVTSGNTGNALNNTTHWDYWGLASNRLHNNYIGLSSGNPFSVTANTTDYKTFAGTTTYKNIVIERDSPTGSILYNNVFFDSTLNDVYVTKGSYFVNNTFTFYQHRQLSIETSSFYNNYCINGGFYEFVVSNVSDVNNNVINTGLLNTTISDYTFLSNNLFNYAFNIDSSTFSRGNIDNNIGLGINISTLQDSDITSNNNVQFTTSQFTGTTITTSNNTGELKDNTYKSLLLSSLTSSVTHLKGNYHCEVYTRQDGTNRLSYVDNSDALTIVAATA